MQLGVIERVFGSKTTAALAGLAVGGGVGYWLGSPSDDQIRQLQASAAPQLEEGKKKKKKKKKDGDGN